MLEGLIWFTGIILCVPVLYIVENYVRSFLPGHNKSYILQPLYRLIKLFGKRETEGSRYCQWFPVISLWFSLWALYFTVTGESILFIFSCLLMMDFFILAGAACSREAFAAVAVRRGISRLAVCAFICFISAASLYRVTGTLNLSGISAYSWSHFLVLQLPLTFLAMIIVLLIRGSILFFDFRITGKELTLLDSALYTPYSGWSLALTQITRWVEIGVWLKLISAFLPWQPWLSFLVLSVCYLGFLLMDGFTAKAQWKRVARNAWLWGGGMSAMNFIWLYLL